MLLQIQLEEIIEKLEGKLALYYNFVTEAEFVLFLVTTSLIKYLNWTPLETSNIFVLYVQVFLDSGLCNKSTNCVYNFSTPPPLLGNRQ